MATFHGAVGMIQTLKKALSSNGETRKLTYFINGVDYQKKTVISRKGKKLKNIQKGQRKETRTPNND